MIGNDRVSRSRSRNGSISLLVCASRSASGSSINNSFGCDSSARRDALALAAGEIARRTVEHC
jgi:hypothetical protein